MHFIVERIRRLLDELNGNIYTRKQEISDYKIKTCGYESAAVLQEDWKTWDTFKIGERWGGKDCHFWFKTVVETPEQFEGKTVVCHVTTGKEGEWDATNPQFLVYVNNKIVQGLDVNHRELILTEKGKTGEVFEIALYAYAGMQESSVELKTFIAILDKEAEKLFYNIKIPLDIADLLEEQDKRRIDILGYMTETVNKLDLRKPFSNAYNESIVCANRYIEEEFYNKFCKDQDIIEMCIGHTHIDVAWLWTLAQTREKVARSFSTVLNLMKQYPSYVFMSSQPQLYQYIKEDHPEIYTEVKQKVKDGRWEAEGAMWLEADCNLSSGESLIRQIIYGKRFLKEEFQVESKILWLPDVFGYSAALPQILQKSGVTYFMTTKISWNEYNQMPHDSFMWRGIDGTEVLTHFISTREYSKEGNISGWTTYNGDTSAKHVMGCWQRYKDKDINNEVLNCFGYGDGGGGPTKEMLENVKRLEYGIPGAPQVRMGTATEYFKRLEKKIKDHKKLPKWVGELYLEYHRGTYTSVAKNKKYNRKTEFLNIDAEVLSVMNRVVAQETYYPEDELKKCWETTLLNQFHDIIPGSSIKEVYEDSEKQYKEINHMTKKIIEGAFSNIAAQIDLKETAVVVFNPLGFIRDDLVTFSCPEGWEYAEVYDGACKIEAQRIEDNKMIFFGRGIPSKGYKTFKIVKAQVPSHISTMQVRENEIINNFYHIKLDKQGHFVSIYDKKGDRELLKTGQRGNVLQAFEDKPHNFDAWDINIYYQEKQWEVEDIQAVEVVEVGEVRSAIKIEKKFMDSIITQIIYVYNDMPRIDFSTVIDWKEKQILLKAAFPVDIHADKATYEIQYGNVERATHWNTSWDYAKFEVCAHKWVDLSEGDYGVSILNDCKYGHDVKDSVMRLTLLKSAVDPHVDADREIHEFVYSLYPHQGGWQEGNVAHAAYNLNCPLYAKIEEQHVGTLPQELSFVQTNQDNVMIEVVKKAEKSDQTIIRMYEYKNKRSKVKVQFCKELGQVSECDLLENPIEAIEMSGKQFSFTIKPYEIKTFIIDFK